MPSSLRPAIVIGILVGICACTQKSIGQKGNIFPLPQNFKEINNSHLLPLVSIIGDARIVASTEANHGMSEPLDFRNVLIKLLVEKKIINLVIIESGITESKVLYNYVLGRPGNIHEVLYDGFSWQFHLLPQNEELIEWLRSYNSDKDHSHKVKLYGFDMSGSPTNHVVHRKMNIALIEVLKFLNQVDSIGYTKFSNKLQPYIPFLHVNFTSEDRQILELYIEELITYLERNKNEFTERSSEEEYAWSCQSAINARHSVNLANYIPLDYKIVSNDELQASDYLRSIVAYRERVMFENFEWILRREPHSRALVFAATSHLLKSPVHETLDSGKVYMKECVGNFLYERYHDDYVVIGNLVGQNEDGMIEKEFFQTEHAHYYLTDFTQNENLPNKEALLLKYQSKNSQLDIKKAVDVVLFNRTQSMVKFRGQ